ncbi:unnamed protein product [Triticum turgidum subsp. durum]|uniref:Uncharacterized protein n=1 Tax=Triticum turgidum subsp. durum TaxID=4567 RepID=A0A9R1AC63_TRITD|nr:unnamed protein product [Triticum turgidum subsp. durum]
MRAEKWLNTFVRFIVLLERAGNGIGTLAFIWATVVVLGGFSTYLGADFWVATLIVFLEGFRYVPTTPSFLWKCYTSSTYMLQPGVVTHKSHSIYIPTVLRLKKVNFGHFKNFSKI